jgi:3-hydroxymyristoyl/3-hydroxydecanoyl-(acyl carrier protein) dehydratase
VTFEVRALIANDHPALAGHFPGNPIVPGVLIIEEVMHAVERWRGQLRLKKVESVKFTAVLKPDHVFDIKLREQGRLHIAFECLLEGSPLASGRLEVELDAGES